MIEWLQVWSYAAGGNNSLGRLEFHNALRLVTVAQSGRQLTDDIVKAALYGPAAAKIPAPKINLTSTSVPQPNQMLTLPTQTGFVRPHVSQMNSVAVSASQTKNTLPQSTLTGFARPPNSQMPAAPLPQSIQSSVMRPPASQMNSMATSSPQVNSLMQQPPLQTGIMRPPQIISAVASSSQANNILLQPTQSGFMRPPASHNATSHPVQGFSQGLLGASTGLQSSISSSLSTDWIAGGSSGPQGAVSSQVPKDGFGVPYSNKEATSKPQIQHVISSPSTPSPLNPVSTSFQTTSKDLNALGVSGNGFSSNSMFGGDVFSASQTKQDSSISISSTSSFSNSFNSAPVIPKNSVNPGQHVNLQVTPGLPPVANQFQRTQPPVKQNHLEIMQNTSPLPVHSAPSGPDSSTSTQNEVPWPKITQSDIRKYTKVFLEVDKDRDGKITGSEARNLFLSWRLPRG